MVFIFSYFSSVHNGGIPKGFVGLIWPCSARGSKDRPEHLLKLMANEWNQQGVGGDTRSYPFPVAHVFSFLSRFHLTSVVHVNLSWRDSHILSD